MTQARSQRQTPPGAPTLRLCRCGLGALLGLTVLLAPALACHSRKAKAPDWILSGPAPTVMAVSGQAGWILEQPQFQAFLEQYPLAEQTLELLLKRAKVSPHVETGRITFYVLTTPRLDGPNKAQPSDFLIQLGSFREPAALQVAIADAFPQEGNLSLNGREHPLFVIMDLNQYHVRAVADAEGRIWMGDLGALVKLGGARLAGTGPVPEAAAWINGAAPFQGYLRPQGILADAGTHLPADLARNLPQGIEALAWSVTPGTGKDSLHRFELAITGSPSGVLQVAPWLQRFAAAATSLQGAPSQAPEVLQENRRIGLKAQLTQTQVNAALAKLNQPGIRWRAGHP